MDQMPYPPYSLDIPQVMSSFSGIWNTSSKDAPTTQQMITSPQSQIWWKISKNCSSARFRWVDHISSSCCGESGENIQT
jgi:hypothetical protein